MHDTLKKFSFPLRESRVQALSFLDDGFLLCLVEAVHLKIHVAAERAPFRFTVIVFLFFLKRIQF